MYLKIVFGGCEPLLLSSEMFGEEQLKSWYKGIETERERKYPTYELRMKDSDGDVFQTVSINTFAIRYMVMIK